MEGWKASFLFGMAYFQVLCQFWECKCSIFWEHVLLLKPATLTSALTAVTQSERHKGKATFSQAVGIFSGTMGLLQEDCCRLQSTVSEIGHIHTNTLYHLL